MELVYCWGKNYNPFSCMDVNFNPRFSFQFNETTQELTFDERVDVVNVFSYVQKNITNVTALIGENGSGKTSFIHFILDCFNIELSRGINIAELAYILIFYSDEKFYIYDNLKTEIMIKSQLKYKFNLMQKATSILTRPYPPMCVIHYTNAFSFSAYRDVVPHVVSSHLYDLSLCQMLHEKAENDLTPDPIIRAYHQATKRQVAAWERWGIASFPRPTLHIHMSTSGRGYYFVKEYVESKWKPSIGEIATKERLLSLCQTIIEKNHFIGRGVTVLHGIIYSLVQWMINNISWNKEERRDNALLKIIEEWEALWGDYTKTHDTDYILLFVRAVFKRFVGGEYAHKEVIEGYKFVVDALLDETFADYFDMTTAFQIKDSTYETISLSKFYENYSKAIATFNDFIVFDWGMSTGEFARFDLFSHIVAMGDKTRNSDENKRISADSFLFILDEIDLYLHPRWQQSFLNDLLQDLIRFFPEKNIQVIFATHSPIFLSDIPDNHVVYFDKNDPNKSVIIRKNKKTFASNIYNLYHDAFFLKDYFGYMGKFSYSILCDIHSEWNQYLQKERNISLGEEASRRIEIQRQIIDMVGEPLLKNVFYKMYTNIMKKIVPNSKFPLTEYEIIVDNFIQLSPSKQEQIKKAIARKKGL